MAKTKCFFRFIQDGDKEKFKRSSCLFTISVGQQTHEAEHFESAIDLINESFDSSIMLVDDSLQRHTMAIREQESADYFYKDSIEEGDMWLERNKKYYSKLKNLKKIVRWDSWLNHPQFSAQKAAIKILIDKDPSYAAAFSSAINDFVNKLQYRISSNQEFDRNRAKRLSFDFILEEATALCLWTDLQCNYEVYPNLHNAAINGTRERFVLSQTPHLLNALTLGFRNAKQLAPQRFICLERQKQRHEVFSKAI